MSLYLSMAAFALAASISPGPVNILTLSAGARYGLRPALRVVTGATVGFTLLLILVGLGLHEALLWWPYLTDVIRWAGVAFLLYMAYRLARDSGSLSTENPERQPSFFAGAALQWLNPKAWLAAVAGVGAFVSGGNQLLPFAAIYFVICYGSIACWAYAGAHLRDYLSSRKRVKTLNRMLAALLVASALYLLLS
ncbi:MAG: lysine transporter LysE [Pseudomonas sp.]|jgi:threonine/homoserine/homoserine lactone efflux protein|uniref:LysE family translocator n=1 Tax=Pseudomonas sp. TaxID=306 RepID=UPI002604F869|nr:LysE family translocator [Pseudomonas sp.]MDB6052316.1 lysine transporter LysE [Pseudomonas sp.]